MENIDLSFISKEHIVIILLMVALAFLVCDKFITPYLEKRHTKKVKFDDSIESMISPDNISQVSMHTIE